MAIFNSYVSLPEGNIYVTNAIPRPKKMGRQITRVLGAPSPQLPVAVPVPGSDWERWDDTLWKLSHSNASDKPTEMWIHS